MYINKVLICCELDTKMKYKEASFMKRIKKYQIEGSQSVYAFLKSCNGNACKTCSGCRDGSAVFSLAQGAQASYDSAYKTDFNKNN